ncbi:acyl-CoA N-acyltransferases (NAT) superfamily protein [Actinidia rufa]|uniref:Acyl-CoA N-acyltransferases (NAT) superfamily protein n=1 Tax=Actinidia rufa TaxID=165716 RepID=A0A7J0G4Y1_9ERIC|nr:acyl-CoA N-acyltransferases (NAT) superfamily protein [Actinidia rufa]
MAYASLAYFNTTTSTNSNIRDGGAQAVRRENVWKKTDSRNRQKVPLLKSVRDCQRSMRTVPLGILMAPPTPTTTATFAIEDKQAGANGVWVLDLYLMVVKELVWLLSLAAQWMMLPSLEVKYSKLEVSMGDVV